MGFLIAVLVAVLVVGAGRHAGAPPASRIARTAHVSEPEDRIDAAPDLEHPAARDPGR